MITEVRPGKTIIEFRNGTQVEFENDLLRDIHVLEGCLSVSYVNPEGLECVYVWPIDLIQQTASYDHIRSS